MLENITLKHVLFLDIETVPQYSSYNEADSTYKKFWGRKAGFLATKENSAEDLFQRAGIYAEFGKIVCISVGIVANIDGSDTIKLKSFYGTDEVSLLKEFSQMLKSFEEKSHVQLCAHNGKEFDFPYISRRMLINGLSLPASLDNSGKKPWEIKHVDTLELWKFGDYKHYTSLDLLTSIFGIPSPKEEIDGSMVASVFYEEKDYQKIKRYCENDVVAVIQLLRKFMGMPLIAKEQIISS